MDLEAFEAVHAGEWAELDDLVRRRRLSGEQADRLVTLYQRTATHLSQVRSAAPDPVLVGRLSTLVARARGRLTGGSESAWRDVARFVTVSCPAALYRVRWWTLWVTALSLLLMLLVGWWVVQNPEVQASLLSEEETRQLVEEDFVAYYTENPNASFAARVFTNNAWIAVQCVVFGVSGFWPVFVLVQNSVNVGLTGGIMAANDAADVFFANILPHGQLELFAVFTAAAAGLKLFWAWIDPGPRRRIVALAQEGRALFTVAVGLVGALALSGLVEGFVTPSGLPTWARIGIGAVALAAWIGYWWPLGRRAVRLGETGDLPEYLRGDERAVSG